MDLAFPAGMAHLWISESPSDWAIVPLGGGELDLARVPTLAAAGPARLTPRTGGRGWVLLAGPGTRLNGLPLVTGVHALDDRDEVQLAGAAAFYFSTERLAQPVPLPGADRPLTCPRCRGRIETGGLAVQCPGCGVWHHATTELPCWTYASTCALCPQSTDPDAGFRWTPEAA